MDAATERIVTYLASVYQVPVNVLFFRYFEDEHRSYLARTWLMDETRAAGPASGSKSQTKQEPWNKQDWYVSFGEFPNGRNWDDARRHGFVSAGGGDWFSRTLRALPIDARVLVHIPKTGYVGGGNVTGDAAPYSDMMLTVDGVTRKMSELNLAGNYVHPDGLPFDDSQDRREWVVPVQWQVQVAREEAFWKPGIFANQNSACKLRSRFTIDEVSHYFEIDT
jgi:hypothetical protein